MSQGKEKKNIISRRGIVVAAAHRKEYRSKLCLGGHGSLLMKGGNPHWNQIHPHTYIYLQYVNYFLVKCIFSPSPAAGFPRRRVVGTEDEHYVF